MSAIMDDFNEIGAEPVVGPVYATRTFALDLQHMVLTGLSYPQPALDGVNVAICQRSEHPAPAEDCMCGFYAYDQESTWWGAGGTAMSLRAVVELSGKIIVCERGLKAEKMRPVAVVTPEKGWHPSISASFRTNYPNVAVFDSEEHMLREFPVVPLVRETGDSGEPREAEEAVPRTPQGAVRTALRRGRTALSFPVPDFSSLLSGLLYHLLIIALLYVVTTLVGPPLTVVFVGLYALGRWTWGEPLRFVAASLLFFTVVSSAMDEITRWSLLRTVPEGWGAVVSALSRMSSDSPLTMISEDRLIGLMTGLGFCLLLRGFLSARRRVSRTMLVSAPPLGVAVWSASAVPGRKGAGRAGAVRHSLRRVEAIPARVEGPARRIPGVKTVGVDTDNDFPTANHNQEENHG